MFLEKCRKVVPDQLLVLFYGTGVILITFGALLLLEKEAYFSILLVPCIILYCLVKRSLYGWYLIRWMLYVHSAFYLVLFAKGVIWTKLEWMTRTGMLFCWLAVAVGLLIGAWYTGKFKALFVHCVEEWISFWKVCLLILLACSSIFWPSIEKIIVPYLDPRVLNYDKYVINVALNQDGTQVGAVVSSAQAGFGDAVILRDKKWTTARQVVTPPFTPLAARFEPQGGYLWIAGESEDTRIYPLTRWSLADHSFQGIETDGEVWKVTTIRDFCFLPSGDRLALFRGMNPWHKYLEILDIQGRELVTRRVYAAEDADDQRIGVSADGRRLFGQTLAENTDKTSKYVKQDMLTTWDVETGDRIGTFPLRSGIVYGIACSPDSRFLYIATDSNDKTLPKASRNTYKGVVDSRDMISGTIDKSYIRSDEDFGLQGMEMSPDGRYLAVYYQDDNKVYLLDANTLEKIDAFKGPVSKGELKAIAFSGNGKFLAIASEKHVKVYSVGR